MGTTLRRSCPTHSSAPRSSLSPSRLPSHKRWVPCLVVCLVACQVACQVLCPVVPGMGGMPSMMQTGAGDGAQAGSQFGYGGYGMMNPMMNPMMMGGFGIPWCPGGFAMMNPWMMMNPMMMGGYGTGMMMNPFMMFNQMGGQMGAQGAGAGAANDEFMGMPSKHSGFHSHKARPHFDNFRFMQQKATQHKKASF